ASGVAFASVSNPIRDEGQDAGAIINGVTATADGKRISVATDFLDLEMELTTAGAQALATINAMTITGGGAKFNLGAGVNLTNQSSVGIGNVAARHLGAKSTGFLD